MNTTTRTDYRLRAKDALEQSVTAFVLAGQAQERAQQLPHSDPEYDAAGRVAKHYRHIGDTLAELHETFTLYAEDNERPRTAVPA